MINHILLFLYNVNPLKQESPTGAQPARLFMEKKFNHQNGTSGMGPPNGFS